MLHLIEKKIIDDSLDISFSATENIFEFDGLKLDTAETTLEIALHSKLFLLFRNDPNEIRSIDSEKIIEIGQSVIDEEILKDERLKAFEFECIAEWNYITETDSSFLYEIERGDEHIDKLINESFSIDSDVLASYTIGQFKKLKEDRDAGITGKNKPTRVTFGLGGEGA